MRYFHDSKNRQWEFTINVNSFKRVRAIADYDLAKLISIGTDGAPNTDELMKLADDEVLLATVVYAVAKPSLDAAGVTEEQFYDVFTGDCVQDAFKELLKEYADFFPKPKGEYIKMTVNLTLLAMDAAAKEVHEAVQKVDLDKAFAQTPEA